jgi:hypothetical protein
VYDTEFRNVGTALQLEHSCTNYGYGC